MKKQRRHQINRWRVKNIRTKRINEALYNKKLLKTYDDLDIKDICTIDFKVYKIFIKNRNVKN